MSSALFKYAQTDQKSANIDQLRGPGAILQFNAYNYKNDVIPYKDTLGKSFIQWTVTNATASVQNGVYPLLSSEDYVYSSQHDTFAERPLASYKYGRDCVRITATGAGGIAEYTLPNTLAFTTKSITDFRFVVKASVNSSTGKVRLITSTGNYREFSYTCSATAGTWTEIKINPTAGFTDSGTFNINSITKMAWVVDTSGHFHDLFCWEAVQLPLQFTSSIISLTLNRCLTSDGYAVEEALDTAMLKCFNFANNMVVTGGNESVTIKSTSQNQLIDAVSRGQMLFLDTVRTIETLAVRTFDGSGNLNLTGTISSVYDLVMEAAMDDGNIGISTSTVASAACLSIDPATLVLSGGSGVANQNVVLKIYQTLTRPIYENRQEKGYIGELTVKRAYAGSGYDGKIYPKIIFSPSTYAMNEGEPGDTKEYKLDVLFTPYNSGIPVGSVSFRQ